MSLYRALDAAPGHDKSFKIEYRSADGVLLSESYISSEVPARDNFEKKVERKTEEINENESKARRCDSDRS
jgi:hypothetical protein